MFVIFFVLLFLLAGCGGTDYPPELVSYGQSADTLQAGESAVFWAVAVDPDGDQVTYSWSASQGYFVDPEEDTVIWQSPENPDVNNVNIQAIITDATGLSFIKDFEIVLTSEPVQQDTTENQPPVITGYGQSLTKSLLGENVSFWIHAEDPEGENLSYMWTATNGNFSSISDDSVNWWTYEYTGLTNIGVIVFDTHGSMSARTFQVKVSGGTWTSGNKLPIRLYNPAFATVDGKIYIIGGNSDGSSLNTTYIYDPSTGVWSMGANMPTARTAASATICDGKIYVIGGRVVETDEYLAVNEVYDPATNTWETRASMPTARSKAGAACVEGKIYVIGGFDGSKFYTINEVYDPATDTWETKASMFTPRNRMVTVVYKGYIYCIGGGQEWYNTTDANERYNPATNSWEVMARLPEGRRGMGWGVIGENLVVFSGKNSDAEYVSRVDVYRFENDRWITGLTGKPTPCENCGCGTVNDTIYLIGGWNSYLYDPYLDVNEVFSR